MKMITVFLALSFYSNLQAFEEFESRMASSENFLVLAPTPQVAQTVLAEAESLRRQLAEEWLGKRLEDGVGPAIIHIRFIEHMNRGRTWPTYGLKPKYHIVWIKSPEDLTLSILGHEMTHVVFATQFKDQLPVWVEEGAASLRDDEGRQTIREEIMKQMSKEKSWPSLFEILEANEISTHDQKSYAVAAVLTEFLLTKGDKRTLLNFALEGKKSSWDKALLNYYGISNVQELSRKLGF